MNRKKWLETFLDLADNNRPAIEYRKRLRLKFGALPKLVKQIPEFRKELQQLRDKEMVEKVLERVKKNERRSRPKSSKCSNGSIVVESGFQKSTEQPSVEDIASKHSKNTNAKLDT